MNTNDSCLKKHTAEVESRPLNESLWHHLHFTLAKDRYSATLHDYYVALVYAVRERLIARWLLTQQRYYERDDKRFYYLSMEYLTGRALTNGLINLGMLEESRRGLAELGLDLDQLIALESEAGLGNGGLGRLAACLLDSMATLGLPGYGYGIRYEYGIFQQKVRDGFQVEEPDPWLRLGNPWEIARSDDLYQVKFFGHVRQLNDNQGRAQFEWVSEETVDAMAYDTPIPGYLNETVNTLRLWTAESSQGFNLEYFNRGDYIAAVEQTSRSRSISRVLYPNDNFFSGKELRLKQEYFLVSATLQDIIRRYRKTHQSFDHFSDKVAIQLNDTHPSLAIPELMRILIDDEQLPWEAAWDLTVATFGYTNHTLLPEALEEWPIRLLQSILPRHVQIIYEINQRFLQAVKRQYPGDVDRLRRMSLIAEEPEKRVRMGHLAVVGSHAVNGVSKMHSALIREQLFRDFDEFFPWRFCSTTNGVSARRWLLLANPKLADLISDVIGTDWIRDLSKLARLREQLENQDFLQRWAEVKHSNKRHLADFIRGEYGIDVQASSLFDCQVKRIHEYKRQLLNVLHTVSLYQQIRLDEDGAFVPRTVIIAGKAAPGYARARMIIKLIHDVAEVINHDPAVKDLLRVVFLPNYNVSLAEMIFPATDLSEQISTAGTEASGTGNMKAMLNGAVTIGTLDGANIEIRDAAGEDNFFVFGKTAGQIARAHCAGYDPRRHYAANPRLRAAVDMIRSGFFSGGDSRGYAQLWESVFGEGDRYMVMGDFADYAACQQRVAEAFRDGTSWTQMSIINASEAGRFSSDQTVQSYVEQIWSRPRRHQS